MHPTAQQLVDLIHEVEVEDPIDFADLPFGEEELYELIAAHLVGQVEAMERMDFSGEERELALLAVAGKLILENLVLHARLLLHQEGRLDASAESLFRRLIGKE